MIYCIDIDNTICATDGEKHDQSIPYADAIEEVNRLFEEGHTIKLFTARGSESGKDWTEVTSRQMSEWNVKHHELIMNRKPHCDIFIDDLAINAIEWRKSLSPKKGILAGTFDLIHPGYIKMFADAKTVCDFLTVALQSDPTTDRPEKTKPVQTIEERKIILEAIEYVDEVILYDTEQDWYNILKDNQNCIRILGTDYKGKPFVGDDLKMEVYFHKRDHSWSLTNLKRKIKETK